jgi:hypothetical protein
MANTFKRIDAAERPALTRLASELLSRKCLSRFRADNYFVTLADRASLAMFRELHVDFGQFPRRSVKSTVSDSKFLRKFFQLGACRQFHISL